MFRRLKFIRSLHAREWLAMLAGGVCLGLLVAWLERKFRLDPRVVRSVLSGASGVLFVRCVIILVAYVKELRREEEEWAGRDDGGDGGGGDADPE